MSAKQNLYAIVTIAQEPIYSEVTEMQQHFARDFKSKAALKVPPHITLIPPFSQPPEKETEIISFMKNFANKQNPFELSINGFSSFGVGVIYAAFEKNETLKKMEKEMSLSFRKKFKVESENSLPFVPHITIAYKDLTPPMFELAWREFDHKLYRRKWMLKYICLLKHNFTEWEIIEHGELKGEHIGETLELGF